MPTTRRRRNGFGTRSTLEIGLKSASTLLLLGGLFFLITHSGCAGPGSKKSKSAPPAPAGLALGQSYFLSGQYDLARAQWRKALYETQESATKHILLRGIGETYWRIGDTTNADLELQKALREPAPGPEKSRTVLLRSIVIERQGKIDEAAALRRSIPTADLLALAAWERDVRQITAARDGDDGEIGGSAGYGVTILPRAHWGPDAIKGNYDLMGKVSRVTVHHSADNFTALDRGSVKSEIRRIQKVHQADDGRHGWADIGYHYLLDRNGVLWEGRPEWMQGAHAGHRKANQGNLGICVLGNYETQRLTPAQENTLQKFLQLVCEKHSISATKIYTHREMHRLYADLKGTDCPGEYLQSIVERIRRNLMPGTSPASTGNAPVLLQAGSFRSKGK